MGNEQQQEQLEVGRRRCSFIIDRVCPVERGEHLPTR